MEMLKRTIHGNWNDQLMIHHFHLGVVGDTKLRTLPIMTVEKEILDESQV